MNVPLDIKIEDDFLLVNGQKIYVNKDLQGVILEEYKANPSNCSLSQFAEISKLPGHIKSVGFPDFHMGYALPIGSAAVIDLNSEEASISPNGVGFDINCGVRCLNTNLFLDDLPNEIKEQIGDALANVLPFNDIPEADRISTSELNSILDKGMEYLKEKGIIPETDLERTESRGSLLGNSNLIGQKSKARGLAQLGTLGSGNHYLEIEVVDEIFNMAEADALNIKKNQILISIHTGSRGLGYNCCADIIKEIDEFNSINVLSRADIHKNLKEEFKKVSDNDSLSKEQKAVLYNNIKAKNITERKHRKIIEKKDPDLLQHVQFKSAIGQKYYNVMNSAANYAWVNRSLITEKVKNVFFKILPKARIELITDVSHNIGKVEKIDGKDLLVLRKGASRILPPGHPELPEEHKMIGQPVLVGGSMGTASYLIVGAEYAKDTYYSTCHGAGRLVPRGKAKSIFSYETIIEDMKARGISYRSGSEEGMVEESGGCYKDVEIVINHTEKVGISKKVCSVRPIFVIKG